jgi:menaquinone-dependent protoporphyrinogen IX oxidase
MGMARGKGCAMKKSKLTALERKQIAYNKHYFAVMQGAGVYMVTFNHKLNSFVLPAFFVEL